MSKCSECKEEAVAECEECGTEYCKSCAEEHDFECDYQPLPQIIPK